jgi:uroporphyrinogen decarboxylase
MTAKPLLNVLDGCKPTRRPIWFMRQAGRYLPEYRVLRAKAGSFLELCYNPQWAAEITLQPIRRYDLDAAIVFADILVVPHAMGLHLDFVEGEGPVLGTVRSGEDLKSLKSGDASERWQRIADTLVKTKARLPNSIALIGFCGGPWTVASYMIEGGGSVEREKARRMAIENPPWFADLLDRLVEESVSYLSLQIKAGAEAVQIFDSWAGDIPFDLRRRLVFEPLARVREGVRHHHPNTPVIVFGRGLGAAHPRLAADTGANGIGIEQGVDPAWLLRELPPGCALQGNLDPMALAVGGAALDQSVDTLLAAVPMERHVFNLGHGVRQETDPAHLAQVIARVRAYDEGRRG